MEFLFVDVIFSFIGRLYLFARFRDKTKIEKIKDEKYEGRFSNAGLVVTLNFFAVLFGLLLFLGLIMGIAGIIKRWT